MKALLSTMFLVAVASLANAGTPVAAKNPKAPVMPAPAPACDMTYNYAELGWLHLDNNLGTSDGGYLDLSYELGHSHFFLDGTASVTGGDFDYREFGAGIGYYLPLTNKLHFVARTGWANVDTDVSSDVNEWYVSPGLRYQVTCNLELYAKAYYHVPEVGDNNWSGGVGALYWVCPEAAITVGGAWGEDSEWSLQAGIRLKL